MTVKRPTYIPQRMDWFPGEPHSDRRITIREGLGSDTHQIRALLSMHADSAHCPSDRRTVPTSKALYKYLSQADYTVNLAVRNSRTAVGICISHQTPDRVMVTHLFVHPAYKYLPLDERLLLLAALELPEQPAQIYVPASDEDRQNRLRDLGWRCVKTQDDEGERTFEYRFLRREDSDGRGENAQA